MDMLLFDQGNRTLWAHFSLGIAKFDTLSNLLLTLGNNQKYFTQTLNF